MYVYIGELKSKSAAAADEDAVKAQQSDAYKAQLASFRRNHPAPGV
jgi:hypothetical protein